MAQGCRAGEHFYGSVCLRLRTPRITLAILMGVPLSQAANASAMADPSALDAFIDYARAQDDYKI